MQVNLVRAALVEFTVINLHRVLDWAGLKNEKGTVIIFPGSDRAPFFSEWNSSILVLLHISLMSCSN